jgi:outer membrane protein TolC
VPGKPLPIDLDTVLHLAQDQNPEIAISREKLHESVLECENTCTDWLPKVTAGACYFRHEGGIQDFNGNFLRSSYGSLFPGLDLCGTWDIREIIYNRVNAERQVMQSKGDLSKLTHEKLLEAANTYIELLTARQAEAITWELEGYAEPMRKRAEDLMKNDRSTTVQFEGVQAEMVGRRQELVKLRIQASAAAAKLGYLLGLPCDALLTPLDLIPAPIDLVDLSLPCETLVALALTDGPGIKEIQGMLAVIQEGRAQLEGPLALMPTFCLNVCEGAFGAGPGANLTWDNRVDVCAQARWNLTEYLTGRKKKQIEDSKQKQVELSHAETAARLTSGVQEARDAILAGREQIALAQQQVRHASESYRLNDLRVKENAPGATVVEVMTAIRALEQAHLGYLAAVSAHNKAQVRLLLLVGPAGTKQAKGAGPAPAGPQAVPEMLPPPAAKPGPAPNAG